MAGDRPWWKDDPAILAATRRAVEDIEQAPDREPLPDAPDPFVTELVTGGVKRELAAARDERIEAGRRYVDAIRAARAVGFSWGEIGRLLGESKQSLHRRFGAVE